MDAITATATGTLIRLRVQPRASRERLEGVRDGYVRLRLTAPPVDGAANAACIAFLTKLLDISRARIHVQAGEQSREKLLHIAGMTPAQVAVALGIASS